MFSLRIVNVDHYMSPPKPGLDLTYSQFRGNQIKSLPVIRIFGSTSSGSKTCLHIHGVFPYILVPYSGAEDPGRIMYQLASSIDKAINISMGKSFSNQQHVFKIIQVSGKPFYGYHAQDHQFFKIYFYNPLIVKRASDLLQNGAVCGTQFQVHEAHVPFILQFFIDYNLYGMSFINVKSVVYRKEGSPPDVPPGQLVKESYCELEADAVAVDILNRLNIDGELAVNPGLAAIWREEKERLQRDAFDSSQRPTPHPTMSEVLLNEKLTENLKFKGKYRANLKENIPYPAETQRSNTSDVLNASMLDTHSIFSLAPDKSIEEMAIIDEELICNMSQNSNSLLSMDQSLLMALDTLAGPNENLCAAMSQNVEDDSILGSQMVPETNNCEEDAEVLEYSLPASALNVSDCEPNSDADSNESFEEGIPQLDGVGDIFECKKEKYKKTVYFVCKENIAIENLPKQNITEETFEDFKENNNCWPESEKSDCLDEIFSDDALNSPTHVIEENSCLQNEPVNIDFISNYDTVLRGDPSFSPRDLSCAEDILLETTYSPALWDNSFDIKKDVLSLEDYNLKSSMNNDCEFPYQDSIPTIDKFSRTSAPHSSNKTNVGPTSSEKTFCLSLSSEDLLSTNQLDEKLDEELNIGIQIIYENSLQSLRRDSFAETNRQDFELTNYDEETYEDCIDFSRQSTAHSLDSKKSSPKRNRSKRNQTEDKSNVEPNRISSPFERSSNSKPVRLTRASYQRTNPNNFDSNNTSPSKVSEVKHEESVEICTYKLSTNKSPEKSVPNGSCKSTSNKRNKNASNEPNLVINSLSANMMEVKKEVVEEKINPLFGTSTFENQATKGNTSPMNVSLKVNNATKETNLVNNILSVNTIEDKKEVIDENANPHVSKPACKNKAIKENTTSWKNFKIKIDKKKTKPFFTKKYNSFKMTKKEIHLYFSQLERLALHLAERTDPIKNEPFVWSPIRQQVKLKRVKHKVTRGQAKIMKRNNFSKQKIAKLTSCSVVLKPLTQRTIDLICKEHNVKINSNLFSNKGFEIKKVNSKSKSNSKTVKHKVGGSSSSSVAINQIVCKNDDNVDNLKKTKKCKSKLLHKEKNIKIDTSDNVFHPIKVQMEPLLDKKYTASVDKNGSKTNDYSANDQKALLTNVVVSLDKISDHPVYKELDVRNKDHTNEKNLSECNNLFPDGNDVEERIKLALGCNGKSILRSVPEISTLNCSSRSGSPKSESLVPIVLLQNNFEISNLISVHKRTTDTIERDVKTINKMPTRDIVSKPEVKTNSSDGKTQSQNQVKTNEGKPLYRVRSQSPLAFKTDLSESLEPIVLLQNNIEICNLQSVQKKTTDTIERVVVKATEPNCRRNGKRKFVKNDKPSKLKKQERGKILSSAKATSSLSKEAEVKLNDSHSFLTDCDTSNVLSCNKSDSLSSSSMILNEIDSSESSKTMLGKDCKKKDLLKTCNRHNKAVVRKQKRSTSHLKLSIQTTNEATNININSSNVSIKEAQHLEHIQKENLNVSNSSSIDSIYQNMSNKHPTVWIDRITEFSFLNKSEKEFNSKEKKRSMSVDTSNMKLSLKKANKSYLARAKKRRSLRLFSLDGTFDNSSSDDNVSDKDGKSENIISTPDKRRPSSSKNCQTPKASYVPLDIKIKKSPKVQVERIIENQSSSLKHFELHSAQTKPIVDTESSCSYSTSTCDSFKRSGNSETVEPCNKITKFEQNINLERSDLPSCSSFKCESSNNVDSSKYSTFHTRSNTKLITKAHPIVKKLKINVRRLSFDTQGGSSNSENLCGMKKVLCRRTSLPIMEKEEEFSTTNINNRQNKASVDSLEIAGHSMVEMKTASKKKGKVRKELLFHDEGSSSEDSGPIPSTSAFVLERETPLRRISSDMFEVRTTPDSISADNSVDSYRFRKDSQFSPATPTDIQKDFQPLTHTPAQSINEQDFSMMKTSKKEWIGTDSPFNRNPHNIANPKIFTPLIKPPTRAEIVSKLKDNGLPEVVYQEPFYSNPLDVAKSSEVGNTTLRLKSKSVTHLEEYEGTFKGISKWKENLQRSQDSHNSNQRPSNKYVVLTPLKNPPSCLQAQQWLKEKLSTVKNKDDVKSKTFTKLVFPSSPGEVKEDDEKDDDSVTLSQCTPLSIRTTPEESDLHLSSPDITKKISIKVSPLMASTPFNNKSTKLKTMFSKPSSSFHKSLQLIKEEGSSINSSPDMSRQGNDPTPESKEKCLKLSETKLQQLLFESRSPASVSCQIDMATPDNSGGYRMELENLQDVKLAHEYQFLTIMTMELHVHTRGELRPDPEHDAICSIFYNINNDHPDLSTAHVTGAIYVNDGAKEEKYPQIQCQMYAVSNEQALLEAFVALVRKWDPDIFVGYEIEMLSWGYLLQRAYVLSINLVSELARVRIFTRFESDQKEPREDDSELQLPGRIVLNLWRFLRHEIALQSYTFESITYHVLHQRVPLFSFCTLTSWWSHRTKLYRWMVFEHYLTHVELTVKLMQQLDLVGRTSEFARLFGIQFYEVLSRGSQFRVESMMLRLAKPLNYVAVSPSVQQRARMRAPESLPLIMEPESRFYSDPVIVLDFQSLYPSIIIAYNYCFSTCLGRVEHLGRSEMFEFGCTQLRVPTGELERLKDSLNFSPCGVAFVKQSVVRGVLPRMLEEILNTRLMVKQSMKENKKNKTLQRVLDARQLGLKLIANVTYGYTAANFSGRMPCIEVGDSVVSKARETLERAISLVKRTPRWGARVVYGDTDSMFVLVKGKSREEAFRIGAEIADAVTNDNPKPIKLKLEKVYQPCLLQTKKRYVGYMYESPNQEAPVYSAKGIETVRRDGCPAVAKVLEKSLRLLFETKDVSLVKRYACRQFAKVLSGRISVQELTFAREYRGASGYKPGACVPALELAKQWRLTDPRLEPRVGQRVPYVIVAGPPGLPLIRLVRSPHALLADSSLKINAEYYITRVMIPPLDRCFSLIGAHVAAWYAEMPRKQQLCLPSAVPDGFRKATISQYFVKTSCVSCERVTTRGVCVECEQQPQQLAVSLATRLRTWERRLALTNKLCESCCGRQYETNCVSLDCPVLYRRNQNTKDLSQADYVRSLQQQYLAF